MICEGIRDIECLALAVAEAEGILVAITWCIVSITHCIGTTTSKSVDNINTLTVYIVETLAVDTTDEVV